MMNFSVGLYMQSKRGGAPVPLLVVPAPPAFSLSIDNTNSIVVSLPSASPQAGIRTQWQLDGGAWHGLAGPIGGLAPDTTYAVAVRYMQNSRNVGVASASQSITTDKVYYVAGKTYDPSTPDWVLTGRPKNPSTPDWIVPQPARHVTISKPLEAWYDSDMSAQDWVLSGTPAAPSPDLIYKDL